MTRKCLLCGETTPVRQWGRTDLTIYKCQYCGELAIGTSAEIFLQAERPEVRRQAAYLMFEFRLHSPDRKKAVIILEDRYQNEKGPPDTPIKLWKRDLVDPLPNPAVDLADRSLRNLEALIPKPGLTIEISEKTRRATFSDSADESNMVLNELVSAAFITYEGRKIGVTIKGHKRLKALTDAKSLTSSPPRASNTKEPLIFDTAFAVFTVTETLGQGGSGTVYRVVDDNGATFAVKRLDPTKATKEKTKRFKNEIGFGQKHVHKNVIAVLDHGLSRRGQERSPFYVMKCYPSSLRILMKRGINRKLILQYFSQLIDGVEAAHLAGIVHRDLKPENVLIDEGTGELVVADFGIAHFQEEDLYTSVETAPGTRLANFQYAAPEQRKRNAQIDLTADIYALGLILNEMFTNEVPQGTEYKTIASIASEHSYLDALIATMLRQNPAERPSSIDTIKKELIGRSQEFVTRQRITELKNTVVPANTIDDPLIADPPRLVNFDWNRGVLTLTLNRAVGNEWIQALNNMGGHTSLMGKGPETFRFFKDKASISATEAEFPQIIKYFKDWLPRANRVYEQTVNRQAKEAEEQERRKLRAEIEEEERRQRILRNNQI